jgi:hypothetical protein
MTLNRRKLVWCGVALLGLCSAVLLFAANFQLTQVTTGNIQRDAWPNGSIAWSLNPSNGIVYSGAGTPANESALQSALTTAFNLWHNAQYQSTNVNTLTFTEGADNANNSFNLSDCTNSIGFTQYLGTGIIAEAQVATSFTIPITTGFSYCAGKPNAGTCPNEICISDADIQFNTAYNFYTLSFTNPTSGYYDFQTVATHEIGHLFGLDHSGLANAVMFPYGDSGTGGIVHILSLDDEIGSAALYTNGSITSMAGQIQGTVTVGGNPAFAAHVVAIDAATGNVVTDTLADNNGSYTLRVFQGNYYVLTLPLATDTSGDSASNGVTTINNYNGFRSGYPSSTAVTNFTGKFY